MEQPRHANGQVTRGPGSWLDWEDHMAHAGEEGDAAGVGVGERELESDAGGRGSGLKGRGGRRRAAGEGRGTPARAQARGCPGTCSPAGLLKAPPALSITNSAI